MNRFVVLALLAFVPGLAAGPMRACADGSRGLYVRGAFGFTGQAQGDLNGLIAANEEFFQSFGIPIGFERFGGTPELGGEVGYRLSETLSLGFSVMRQNTKVGNGFADTSGSFSDHMQATLTEFAGNLTFWPPAVPGFFLGAQAGAASGSFKEVFALRDFNDSSNDADLHGKWTGSGAVFGIFAGFQQSLAGRMHFFSRLGYRFRKLGKFDGSFTDVQAATTYPGKFENNSGEAVEFDFSGVHALAGVGIALGGGR